MRKAKTVTIAKYESAATGDGVVDQLAARIAKAHPDHKGFPRANLFRMRQFSDAYRGDEKVAPATRPLPVTQHLLILGRAKRSEEREFSLRMADRISDVTEYRRTSGFPDLRSEED